VRERNSHGTHRQARRMNATRETSSFVGAGQQLALAALRMGDNPSLWDNQTGSSPKRTGRVVRTSISIDVMKMMKDEKTFPERSYAAF